MISIDHPTMKALRAGVIVSCQAGPDSPLNSPKTIAALAMSAERGGAVGFRVDGAANIRAVKARSARPVLGINKKQYPDFEVFITPTLASARAIAEAGADLIAIDGTRRPRPGGERFDEIVAAMHEEYELPVMADIATAHEALAALDDGADLVATTIAGYTSYSTDRGGPAFDVLEAVAGRGGRVVVEGRIWTVEDVARAFELGAYAVVIGSAVTVPEFITRRFVAAIPEAGAA